MKIVTLLSGGMDSVTLLHLLTKGGNQVRALGVNYGQRHGRELSSAAWQAESLGVPFSIVDLQSLKKILPGSSQTDPAVEVPEGHYSEESMKKTVVPNRNMILLSIAIGHAIAHEMDAVAFAAHAGDHAIYPDCREEFATRMNAVAGVCDWRPIQLLRPFIGDTKGDIVKKGIAAGVDYSMTWSCYKGGDTHCGRCGTCVERILAFEEAGEVDPVHYQDLEFAFAAERKFQSGQ